MVPILIEDTAAWRRFQSTRFDLDLDLSRYVSSSMTEAQNLVRSWYFRLHIGLVGTQPGLRRRED